MHPFHTASQIGIDRENHNHAKHRNTDCLSDISCGSLYAAGLLGITLIDSQCHDIACLCNSAFPDRYRQ